MAPVQIPQYTEQDIRDVLYYAGVENEPDDALDELKGKHTPVEARLWEYEAAMSPLDFTDPEDLAYFQNVVIPQGRIRYNRGKEIAMICDLLPSRRSIVLSDADYEEMSKGRTLVSPVIRWPAGYIATREAERYYALALRKDYMKQQE